MEIPLLILQWQRGFRLLPVVGLTSTLMITWEVITASVPLSKFEGFHKLKTNFDTEPC